MCTSATIDIVRLTQIHASVVLTYPPQALEDLGPEFGEATRSARSANLYRGSGGRDSIQRGPGAELLVVGSGGKAP